MKCPDQGLHILAQGGHSRSEVTSQHHPAHIAGNGPEQDYLTRFFAAQDLGIQHRTLCISGMDVRQQRRNPSNKKSLGPKPNPTSNAEPHAST